MNNSEISPLVYNPLPHTLEGYDNSEDVFTRHDKNIANNVADFFIYRERAKLCMNLAMYFQFVYQRNNPDLYGYYIFNIKHFSELFVWNDSLQRVVENKEELYITHHRDQIYRAFDVDDEKDIEINERMINNIERFGKTKIGDAFLRLRFQSIIYSNKSFYYEGDSSSIYTGQSVTFLNEFTASYKEIKGRATRLYINYRPNEKYILNNVKIFAYTNCQLVGQLRKNGLDFLHVYISYVLNTLKTSNKFSNIWTINKRSFSRLLGLNPNREIKELNKEIRRKYKKYQTFKGVEEIIFSLPYTDFIVKMEFTKLEPATKDQRKRAIENAFRRHFEDKLFQTYVENHVNVEENPYSFREWILNKRIDIEQKKFAYITSQRVIFKKNLSINDLGEKDLIKIGISEFIESNEPLKLEDKNRKVYPGKIFK